MTWQWELIREEACRSYAEGNSLTEVKKTIKRRRPEFNASDRAFRIKFKEWGVKRPRRTKADSIHIPTERTLTAVGLPADTTTQGVSASSTAFYEISSPAPAASVRQAHRRPHISHSCSCRATLLDNRVRELFALVESGCDVLPGWISDHFEETGVDNVIHTAVRDVKWSHMHPYDSVLEFLLGCRSDLQYIDSRDCDGMTALEIAIREDNLRAVNILLNHEASLTIENGDQLTPLGFALEESSNVQLIAGLLRRTKEAGLSYGEIGVDDDWFSLLNAKALQSIDKIMASPEDGTELEDALFVIGQLVLYTQRGSDSADDSRYLVLRTLLESWDQRQLWFKAAKNREYVRGLLHELSRDILFYCPWDENLWQRKYGKECTCVCGAAFAIFHIQDEELIEKMLTLFDEDILRELCARCAYPCPARQDRGGKPYLSKLLATLFNISSDSHKCSQKLLARLFEVDYDKVSPCIWEALAKSCPDEIHLGTFSALSLALRVLDLPEPSHWDVSELWLSRDPGFPLSGRERSAAIFFPPHDGWGYCYYASNAYLDHLLHWFAEGCRAKGIDFNKSDLACLNDWIASKSCGCHAYIKSDHDDCEAYDVWNIDARWAVKMQRCVVNIVTKDLCKPESLFAPTEPLKERIQSALQFREEFNLPALVIEQSLLLHALSGVEVRR